MTQKRLLKLLMGNGISRNKANQMAVHYRDIGMPYLIAWWDYLMDLHSVSVSEHIQTMTALREEVAETLGVECKTIKEMVFRLKAASLEGLR